MREALLETPRAKREAASAVLVAMWVFGVTAGGDSLIEDAELVAELAQYAAARSLSSCRSQQASCFQLAKVWLTSIPQRGYARRATRRSPARMCSASGLWPTARDADHSHTLPEMAT